MSEPASERSTDTRAPAPDETDDPSPHEKRFEVVATVVLALAALATAWSGYQASLWDGIQSSDYTQASALRTRSAQKHTEANQFRLADLSVFENFVDATATGDTELAAFYRTRIRDEFEPAFSAWIALEPLTNRDAPPTPFTMPEYRLADDRESVDLADQADAKFAAGEDANTYSDTYTATTLFFAAALFFAAISERFDYRRARVGLLSLAAIGLILGTVVVVTQPVTSG